MSDSYTTQSHEGWFSRLGKSITGVLFGVILFSGSFPLLWWGEGRSVKTAKGLAEGEKSTVEIAADKVDPAAEGKLVHLIAKASATEPAEDPQFGLSAPGLIKLLREVETFQWSESKHTKTTKRAGGGEDTVTTYSYETGWHDGIEDSSRFQKPAGHQNPSEARFDTKMFVAPAVTIGSYKLPDFLLDSWSVNDLHPLPKVEELPEALGKGPVSIDKDWLFFGASAQNPVVGDTRVKFRSIMPGDASVLARQVRDTFEPHTTSYDTTIARITSGVVSTATMFADARSENTFLAWLLRIAGFFAMFFGLWLVLTPLKVLADVIPFVGTIANAGIGFISFLTAVLSSLITIGTAWIWYRPMYGITLLILAGGAFYLIRSRFGKTSPRAIEPPAVP